MILIYIWIRKWKIFKYLDDTQYDNIYDRPFELDLLICLTELAYLSFDGLVASDLDLKQRLQEAFNNNL